MSSRFDFQMAVVTPELKFHMMNKEEVEAIIQQL